MLYTVIKMCKSIENTVQRLLRLKLQSSTQEPFKE